MGSKKAWETFVNKTSIARKETAVRPKIPTHSDVSNLMSKLDGTAKAKKTLKNKFEAELKSKKLKKLKSLKPNKKLRASKKLKSPKLNVKKSAATTMLLSSR